MKHIAVIGSGIAGLAAAYLLSRRHRVTLYERADRLGGHTHTVAVEDEGGSRALDTGFLVHNVATYPNLIRLFDELGVRTQPSDMSFSVSCPDRRFEYSSRGLRGFFAERRALLRPAQYRLLRDIARFNREAPALLSASAADSCTMGDYLADHGYGDEFVGRYLLPMAAAIWSASFDGIARFPAPTMIRFMQNHGMLTLGARPAWRVVCGGSGSYIPKLSAPLGPSVHTGVHLVSVRRSEAGVCLAFANRPAVRVDEVVFACHGDQVLKLLADASDVERDVFTRFSTTTNEVWLHTDDRFLPSRPAARASWNYRLGPSSEAAPSVTYHLNRLQSIPGPTQYCVTLNPQTAIDAGRVIRRLQYAHPQYSISSVAAQARWREVSGVRHTHYCGAYWRYGFHEDGLVSAIRVARDLGVTW